MDNLLNRLKKNLIIEHTEDDDYLKKLLNFAIAYAESYQHLPSGTYQSANMSQTTIQAVMMLAPHMYESRDGSTGGFFADNVQASQQVWAVVNSLLRLDREWQV